MNKTYKLYQIGMVSNSPICTYISEVQAENIITAEELLLANMPDDNVEYLILVVK